MTSSLELAADVCASPCPLMFLDTAAILDILRVPYRFELQVDIINAASGLVEDAIATPRRVWLVSTANVMDEFQSNRETVVQELSGRVSNLNQSILRLSRVASLLVPEKGIQHLQWLDVEFEQRIAGVMDRFAHSVMLFRGSSECVGRARDRLWAGRPPASKSKHEFKDCEIFEEFLELAHVLRKAGFCHPIVFVTSNSNDYGKPPNGHAQIASDLAAIGSEFAGNISWARAVIQKLNDEGM